MKRKNPPAQKSGTSGKPAKGPRGRPRKPQVPEVLPAEEPGHELEELEEQEEPTEEPADEEISSSLPVPASEISDSDLVAISPQDPLRRYLEEVRRYPLLAPEEEFHLAMRLRTQGDLAAAKTLVSANLRLVVKIAFEYRTMYSNILDLIQEGNIGLMKAVSKFDPTKGARLGYYASWWIRSYILKYLLDNFRLVKIGTTQAQKKLFYHLVREKERLEAQGLLAGPKLLAEKLNVREKDVVEMEHRLSGRGAEMSLDAPIDREGGTASYASLLPDETEPADESLARQQLLRLLADRLPAFEKTLNEKERKLLRDRLLAEEPKTLQEVADLYGLTRERARQIEAKVIQKLRDFLRPVL
ncbi:MAG: RNA polymerase factor sigma-32 [Oligoflexia bacterium]|nr:RNA polymerase factor sigma-32 [Oligoflexia bacterium]